MLILSKAMSPASDSVHLQIIISNFLNVQLPLNLQLSVFALFTAQVLFSLGMTAILINASHSLRKSMKLKEREKLDEIVSDKHKRLSKVTHCEVSTAEVRRSRRPGSVTPPAN